MPEAPPEAFDAAAAAGGIWWPFVVMIAGALATYLWRALGVALSGRIDPSGEIFEWAACIAYALLAGLIARMILLPVGPLAEIGDIERIAAALAALAVYFFAGRRIPLGVGVGIGLLALLAWAGTQGFLLI